MRAWADLQRWPATNVAGAVVARGTIETFGDANRPFPLASVTKWLVALVAAVAVEEGTVSLDDPAGPDGSTIRHLLAHASGLGPDGEHMADVGRRRIYSNAGFEIVGDTIGASAGMTFAEYARDALVVPLDLRSTTTEGSPAKDWSSSAADLAAVANAVRSGSLLAPTTVAALRAPAFPDLAGVLPGYGRQDPNPWGLGVEVRGHKTPHWTSPDNSPETYGHFGQSGTFVWTDPTRDLTTIVLTDHDFGPWAVEAWPPFSTAVIAEHTS